MAPGFNKLTNPYVDGVKNATHIYLKRASFYKNGLKFEHSKKLDGLFAMFIVFSTLNYKNTTMYNNWNFPSPPAFDEFWFDDRNTTFLYHSLNYEIGKDQIAIARIRVTPEIMI